MSVTFGESSFTTILGCFEAAIFFMIAGSLCLHSSHTKTDPFATLNIDPSSIVFKRSIIPENSALEEYGWD